MTSKATAGRVLYQNLHTSFVNLWALLRYLSQHSFVGRVHVELENYEADVFVRGTETPLVHEIDRTAGTDVVEEAALHRLVLRVRESPGTIAVYEGADEAVALRSSLTEVAKSPKAAMPESMRSNSAKQEAESVSEESVNSSVTASDAAAADEWHETLRLSGELIAAIERAAVAMDIDFAGLLEESRVALADDYPFLDPMTGLRYEEASVALNSEVEPAGFVAGVGEALRRIVDQLATGDRARRARERVALELSRVARRNSEGLARSGFQDQLDRIAGTKVV